MDFKAWDRFVEGPWKSSVDVRDFIQRNYRPYEGDEGFLAGPGRRTRRLTEKLTDLLERERSAGGVLDIDTRTVSSLTSYGPGYLDRELELIAGLQTDQPLRRGVNPFGGVKMTRQACEAYGYQLSDKIEQEFTYRTTHNDGVFRIYNDDIKAARKAGLITGLPDAYGRGRIIGDYRRVALYGADALIAAKKEDKKALGAIKEQNGAAMSLGRVTTFLDIYLQRDLDAGLLDEDGAQELMDHFVIKLRMARHLRTPEYNELFAGDPMWITEAIGGVGEDGRTLVTKSSFRILHTLHNLGCSAEPNLTVLWSKSLPEPFKKYAAAGMK